jgi:hypothetical protein
VDVGLGKWLEHELALVEVGRRARFGGAEVIGN